MPRIDMEASPRQPKQASPRHSAASPRTPVKQTYAVIPEKQRTHSFRCSNIPETIETPLRTSVLDETSLEEAAFYAELGRKVMDLVSQNGDNAESERMASVSKSSTEEIRRLREENSLLRLHLRKSSGPKQLPAPQYAFTPWKPPTDSPRPWSSEKHSTTSDHFNVSAAQFAKKQFSTKTFSVSSMCTRSMHPASEVLDFPNATPSSAGHSIMATRTSTDGGAAVRTSTEGSSHATHIPRLSQAYQEKKDRLMKVFSLLDADSSGSIATEELRHALRKMGESPAHARRLMAMADRNNDGSLDREEWETIVDDLCQGKPLSPAFDFAEDCLRLYDSQYNDSEMSLKKQAPLVPWHRCLISYRSGFRITWDLFLASLLMYIAVMTPFEMGYLEDDEFLSALGLTIDSVFLLDVVLNFRTTYVDRNGNYITDGRTIALHYLRTWFLIDFISSLPLDYMTSNWLPNLQLLKFGKSGKLFKIVKMWRLTKVAQIVWVSHAMEVINDFLAVTGYITIIYMTAVLSGGVLVCHWLACFSSFVAVDGFVESYLDGEFVGGDPSIASRYLAAQYWAVTTMTTVGYGDITPYTDVERAFAIIGMISGCAFYSYLIGYMAVVVGNRNLNDQAYQHRLEEVRAWMDHHIFTKEMRHRIWRYFKLHLKMKSIHESFTIIQELSPELRQAVCFTIVHEDVRLNPIFDNVPPVVMTILASIVKKVISDAEEPITSYGDYGFAMCVILSGTAVIERNGCTAKTRDDALKLLGSCTDSQVMLPSDSFGEEIVLGLERHYLYSVVSATKVQMAMIPADDFLKSFAGMPELVSKMRYNYMGEHDHLLSQLMY